MIVTSGGQVYWILRRATTQFRWLKVLSYSINGSLTTSRVTSRDLRDTYSIHDILFEYHHHRLANDVSQYFVNIYWDYTRILVMWDQVVVEKR